MRIWVLFFLILFLELPSSGPAPLEWFSPDAKLWTERVQLDPRDPSRVRVGALTYLGGIRLKGSQAIFGGFSSMRVEGDRFTLLSDSGNILSFNMGADWTPRSVQFSSLSAGPETGWLKGDRDSESQTGNPATGQVWVGFEQFNEIWRYGRDGRYQAHAAPSAMADWDSNGGPESMVRLRDGSFLVISETTHPRGAKNGRGRDAIRFLGDPTDPKTRWYRWVYVAPFGYDPTDMAQLPDGRVLVLNRRVTPFDFFTAKLVILDPRKIARGAKVGTGELATLAAPVLHDNYEALAITQEGKDVIVWLATDDNQMWFEQSLLLKFRLEMR